MAIYTMQDRVTKKTGPNNQSEPPTKASPQCPHIYLYFLSFFIILYSLSSFPSLRYFTVSSPYSTLHLSICAHATLEPPQEANIVRIR